MENGLNKILVFSDSHGHFNTMLGIAQKEQPDIIVHLGDGVQGRRVDYGVIILENEGFLCYNDTANFAQINFPINEQLQ